MTPHITLAVLQSIELLVLHYTSKTHYYLYSASGVATYLVSVREGARIRSRSVRILLAVSPTAEGAPIDYLPWGYIAFL